VGRRLNVSTVTPPPHHSISYSFVLPRITAQLIGPRTKEPTTHLPLQDWDLVEGSGRSQYASFTWADLAAIAPWLEIPKKIDGPGLGND
jgi:hypothetical protein